MLDYNLQCKLSIFHYQISSIFTPIYFCRIPFSLLHFLCAISFFPSFFSFLFAAKQLLPEVFSFKNVSVFVADFHWAFFVQKWLHFPGKLFHVMCLCGKSIINCYNVWIAVQKNEHLIRCESSFTGVPSVTNTLQLNNWF